MVVKHGDLPWFRIRKKITTKSEILVGQVISPRLHFDTPHTRPPEGIERPGCTPMNKLLGRSVERSESDLVVNYPR